MWGASIGAEQPEWIHVPSPLDTILMYGEARAISQKFFNHCVAAAHNGSANAVATIALMAYNGFLDGGKDRLSRSSMLANISASAENEYGQFVLALSSLEEQSYRTASELFAKSGNAGFGPSAWFLGKLYEHGIGLPQDRERAASCFQRAAELKFVGAERSLCDLARLGFLGLWPKFWSFFVYPYVSAKYYFRVLVRGRHFQTHLAPQRALDVLAHAIRSETDSRRVN